MSEPSRRIIQADAIAWMEATPPDAHASVVTSLPDASELPHLDLDAWRAWFVDAARRVIRWVPEDGVAIFFQSDIRIAGALVDKGYLVMRAAEHEGASLLFHKIVCRRAPGTIAFGRPSYSHMIAVTRGPTEPPRSPGPDVLPDAGHMPWSRAMGVAACRVACRYLLDNTATRVVVDPFCGRGTVLAIANSLGLDAVGVDVSARRCRAARSFVIREPGSAESGHDALARGARLFDEGAFFDAHEVWEERWRVERGATERLFFQGLVQIAAGFHKLVAVGDQASAERLLTRGLAKLDSISSAPEGLEALPLASFRERLRACAGSVRDGSIDRSVLPRTGL